MSDSPATTTIKTGTRSTCAILVLLAMVTRPALSAPWEFSTDIDLGITYTDNLLLAEDGEEIDDLVFVLEPTFFLVTEGDRLTADLRYRPSAYFYNDFSQFDEVFHTVDMSLTATLMRNALFVDASAANFQTIVTPDATIPTSNVPITGNRIDSRVLQIRPYWEQNLGFANILADIAFVDTTYDDLAETIDNFAQDNQETRGSVNLNNYENQQGFAWGANYQNRRVDYDDSVPWKYERAGADLGYWVSSTTRLFVSGGLETGFDAFLEGGLDDDFWEGGFQYRPNQRLDFEVAVGERSYGDSYRGSLSYELRRGQFAMSYSEEPSTLGSTPFGRNPLVDTDSLDNALNRPSASDSFIRKRGEISVSFELAKSDMSLRVFSESREQRATIEGDTLDDEEFSGVAFRWNWRLGSKSTLGFLGDFSHRETDITNADLTRIAVDYSYRLSQRLSVMLMVQRSDDEGADIAGQAYVENQVRLTLRAEY